MTTQITTVWRGAHSDCEHLDVRRIDQFDVECLDCGIVGSPVVAAKWTPARAVCGCGTPVTSGPRLGWVHDYLRDHTPHDLRDVVPS